MSASSVIRKGAASLVLICVCVNPSTRERKRFLHIYLLQLLPPSVSSWSPRLLVLLWCWHVKSYASASGWGLLVFIPLIASFPSYTTQSPGINLWEWELPPTPGARPLAATHSQVCAKSQVKSGSCRYTASSAGRAGKINEGGWRVQRDGRRGATERWEVGERNRNKMKIKERNGDQAERRERGRECEPCWNHSAQISTMCPPEPYYPINELYWGNKVLWSSAKNIKGARLSRPGARRSPVPQGTNEKRKRKQGPRPRVGCPDQLHLTNRLLVAEK